jgi:hypothetical protein
MAYTLQQTINAVQPFVEYNPLTAGVANEPAISIANMIQNTVTNPPFTWPWNRDFNSNLDTMVGIQDYTVELTDFSFLEKVSLTDSNGNSYEVKDVYNNRALSESTTQERPKFVSVQNVTYNAFLSGGNVDLRFLGVPDQIYVVNLTFQRLIAPITSLTSPWSLPDSFIDVYNTLFLAEAYQTVGDARAAQYRQRGIAALLAKAEGLSEMDKNLFLGIYLDRDSQTVRSQLKTQQGVQARSV